MRKANDLGVDENVVDSIRSLFFESVLSKSLRDAIEERGRGIRLILGNEDEAVTSEAIARLGERVNINTIANMKHQVIDDPIFYWHYGDIIHHIESSISDGFRESFSNPPPPHLDARDRLVPFFDPKKKAQLTGATIWKTIDGLPSSERNRALVDVIQLLAYYHGADDLAEAIQRKL